MANGPRTVGIIMDGNRRWRKARGLSTTEGHLAGKEVLSRLFDDYGAIQEKWGTENYIFYAFSTENWSRSVEEVAALMGIFEQAFEEFKKIAERLQKHGLRMRFVGARERFSDKLQKLMQEIEESTAQGTGGTIAFAVSYGGRAEILQAVNQLIEDGQETVTEELLGGKLWTAGIPDPDLIIRTSGEQRLSNFLTWQGVYSELAFTDTLWPDFTTGELEKIFEDYALRERRKGK